MTHKHEYYIRGNSKRIGEVLLGCKGCTEKFQARIYTDVDGTEKIGTPYQTAKPKADKKRGIQLRLYDWQRKRVKRNKTTPQKLLDDAISELPEVAE